MFFPHLELFSLLSVSPCLVLSVFEMMGPWQKKWLQTEIFFPPPSSSPCKSCSLLLLSASPLFASVLTHLCSFVGLTQRGSTVLMYFYIFFPSKATKKGRLGSGGACLPHVEARCTKTDDARSVSVPHNLCLEANFKIFFHKAVLLNSLSGKTSIHPSCTALSHAAF